MQAVENKFKLMKEKIAKLEKAKIEALREKGLWYKKWKEIG